MQYMYTERAHLMCPQMYFDIVETEALYEAFQSRAGAFVGGNMFGYKLRNGYSITNLGRIENDAVGEAMFIPTASPAMKKTLGALTVNGQMVLCVSERKRRKAGER